MSSPPPLDPPTMPTMVSRLPKFSSQSKPAPPSSGVQVGPAAAVNTETYAGTRLTNGFYHHPGPAGVSDGLAAPPSSVKHNGFTCLPASFSLKWKQNGVMKYGGNTEKDLRGGKVGNVAENHTSNHGNQYYLPRQQGSPERSPLLMQRDAKRPTMSSAGKGRGLGQPVTSSASPSPQSSLRTLCAPKTGPYSTKQSQGTVGLTSRTKQTVNGHSGSNHDRKNNGSLGPTQSSSHPGKKPSSRLGSGPGFRFGFPLQNKPPASRSHSSDNLGSRPPVHLTEGDRFRSRSLTQVRRLPSPNLTPSSTSTSSSSSLAARSYSNYRAAERGLKVRSPPPAQTPPTGSSAKPAAASTGTGGGGRGGGRDSGGVKAPSSALGRSKVNSSILLPSALKKPLLPSLSPASTSSGISYKLSRPPFIRQPRPLQVTSDGVGGAEPNLEAGGRGWKDSVGTPSGTEKSPEPPETRGTSAGHESQREVSVVGETLDDMSLSSTSSLDKNDTSQEYMDDFDNFGSGGIGVLLLSSKNDDDDSGLDPSCTRFEDQKTKVNGVTEATELCFLDDCMDWTDMRLDGEHQPVRLCHQRKSSQPDYNDQGDSSLDLSPSDSCGSGGTYMWDEEGLEPLGGATATASISTDSNATDHVGSFESDHNSIDILNDLDSCDLDDDDLMLDTDFLEDASLHSDRDRMSHMDQWRRRLCWGTQDVHNENRDFHSCEITEDAGNKRAEPMRNSELILDLCLPRSSCLTPDPGLDVEELADNCSEVRSQLEHLQKLLLQEEDVDEDTPSPEAADSFCSADSQVKALQQEVLQLREELRSRDRTIAQLSQQLETVPTAATRCRCQDATSRHTQTGVMERASVGSQTPWRQHASQILHPSSKDDQKPLTDQIPGPSPTHLQPAPPPCSPCSARPSIPADLPPRLLDRPDAGVIDPAPERREDDGNRAQKEEEVRGSESMERRGTQTRTIPLTQPSKLRLLHTFSPAPSSGTPGPGGSTSKTRAARQLPAPHYRKTTVTSGLKVKTPSLSRGESRLPKPKSH